MIPVKISQGLFQTNFLDDETNTQARTTELDMLDKERALPN